MAWGFPMIVPALKDAYLNQLFKKTDEVIAQEHSVPMRFVFPQPLGSDPMKTIPAAKWKNFMDHQVKKWRHDKNAIMTSPYPVGQAQLSGDGAQYFTGQLRRFVIDEIIEATGHSRQLLGGGLMYSAGNVNMRILENAMMSYTQRLDAALMWVYKQLRDFCNLPEGGVTRKPFKMADDVQMLQLLINMAMNNKMDWREIYDRLDLDYHDHIEQLKKEATLFGEIDSDRQMTAMRSQLEGAKFQAESEQLAAGWQSLTQDSIDYTNDLMAQLTGRMSMEDAEKSREEQQQQEAQMQQRMQEAQVSELESRAQKNMAQAGEDKSQADVHDAWAAKQIGGQKSTKEQVREVVKAKILKRKIGEMNQLENPEDIAQQLMQLDEKSMQAALQSLQVERGGEFTGQIAQLIQQQQQEQQQQQQEQQQQQDPQAIAQQLMQLPPEQQQQAFEQLNPELAKQVAGIIQQVQQQQQNVVQIAQQLMQLPPDQQQRYLAVIEKKQPEFIEPVMQVMESMNVQSTGQNIFAQIKAESKNISDVSEKIFMLDPKAKSSVLNYLAQTSPDMLAVVLNRINELRGISSTKKDIDVVDMRQLPSQKPPRRKT